MTKPPRSDLLLATPGRPGRMLAFVGLPTALILLTLVFTVLRIFPVDSPRRASSRAPSLTGEEDSCLTAAAIQAIVAEPRISRFLHPDLPDRRVLFITGSGVSRVLTVPPGPLQVQASPAAPASAVNVMTVTHCQARDGRLRVSFRYPIEGLEGIVVLTTSTQHTEVAECHLVLK